MYQRMLQMLLTLLLPAGAVMGAEVELFTCSESGTGTAYFKVCVSNTGNVTLFKSPWGMEHIRVADDYYSIGNVYALEGYIVCREWWDPTYQQYDYDPRFDLGGYYRMPGMDSRYDMVLWGWYTSKIVQPTPGKFPLTIYTKEWDGGTVLWELKQDFAVDTAERELTITMTLYNRSGQLQKDVKLGRAVQLKIDNSGEGEVALFGARSAAQFDSGQFGGSGNAVSLTALTTNYPSGVGASNYKLGWGDGMAQNFCYGWPTAARDWFSGEGEIGSFVYSFGNLAAGASRTVKFAYRAF